jgi:signal peptidase II
MSRKKNLIYNCIWFLLTLALILADRVVKSYILNNVSLGETFGSIKYIADFIYVQNTGAAFSILSENTFILSIVSVVFCIAVIIYKIVKKPEHPLLNLTLVLMFSGALGNAIDRIAYSFVVDFISIKWFDFPVFNIADMAIVGGAITAIIYVLFFDKDKLENKTQTEKDGEINNG